MKDAARDVTQDSSGKKRRPFIRSRKRNSGARLVAECNAEEYLSDEIAFVMASPMHARRKTASSEFFQGKMKLKHTQKIGGRHLWKKRVAKLEVQSGVLRFYRGTTMDGTIDLRSLCSIDRVGPRRFNLMGDLDRHSATQIRSSVRCATAAETDLWVERINRFVPVHCVICGEVFSDEQVVGTGPSEQRFSLARAGGARNLSCEGKSKAGGARTVPSPVSSPRGGGSPTAVHGGGGRLVSRLSCHLTGLPICSARCKQFSEAVSRRGFRIANELGTTVLQRKTAEGIAAAAETAAALPSSITDGVVGSGDTPGQQDRPDMDSVESSSPTNDSDARALQNVHDCLACGKLLSEADAVALGTVEIRFGLGGSPDGSPVGSDGGSPTNIDDGASRLVPGAVPLPRTILDPQVQSFCGVPCRAFYIKVLESGRR